MLLKFRVANYRSIRDEQELSFVATELNEGTAREIEIKPSGRERVLPVIGVYGANASGKSNVLNALIHLGRLARGILGRDVRSQRRILGWDPHALDTNTSSGPTRYEVEFVAGAVRHTYGIEFTREAVTAEWLHAYPLGRRQVWFERDPDAPDRLRFPDNHLGSTTVQSTLADLARPDRPFLGLASEVRHEKLAPVAEWFGRLNTSLGVSATSARFAQSLVPLFEGDAGLRVVDLLSRADRGIDGAEVIEVDASEFDFLSVTGDLKRREVRLRHRGRTGSVLLPLQLESAGTRTWLRILRSGLHTLDTGGLLVVDELDASLHPTLAAEAIRMFYDQRLNRHGAQLLFSTHDVSLLSPVFGRTLLDRDQVWFTEKDPEGATELFPLADLKPRRGENIQRGYLMGRYGAVPDLSPGELAMALWPHADQAEGDEG